MSSFRIRAVLVLMVLCATATHCLRAAGTLAQFRTVLGDIEVELRDTDKPVTTRNFIRYVESGAYTNMFLHRCVPGFIVQGGGFLVTNSVTDTNYFLIAYRVASFGNITNEYLVGPRVSNTYGTIAMAKVGDDPNSASSQWFFNLANNSANLDNQNGGFTVFGHVVRGTNVLENFNQRAKETSKGIVDLRDWHGPFSTFGSTFSDLPVNYDASADPNNAPYPNYDNLLYVDVTLLRVAVAPVENGRSISWDSVSNRVNQVEFTTNFPPVWHSLVSTNGNGDRFSVIDTSSAGPSRFYRIRADF